MKNVYFISYTIYADGDYQQIINKGSTTMELTVSELRQLGKVQKYQKEWRRMNLGVRMIKE
jgi:hypothetical protein